MGIDNVYLAEFNKSTDNDYIERNKKTFEKARKYINQHKKENHGVVGNWHRAETIYQFSLDGLHCGGRISTHILKYVILFAIDYYCFIFKDKNKGIRDINHGDANYVAITTEQIIHHFQHCCKIPFKYDEENPTKSKIHFRMFYF